MKKTGYVYAGIFLIILACFAIISAASDSDGQIRPANQKDDRGESSVRPANQDSLPDRGDYTPTQGSSYSSGYHSKENSAVKMQVNTNTTNMTLNSNATLNGTIDINTRTNELNYNLSLNGLSNETRAFIYHMPEGGNLTELFELPLGDAKVGMLKYNQNMEMVLISGDNYIRIDSLLFPQGEIIRKLIKI